MDRELVEQVGMFGARSQIGIPFQMSQVIGVGTA